MPEADTPQLHPPIVVIEDDDAIRDAVQQVLELDGYPVVSFANGKEALDAWEEVPFPCLILLDLMMPVMDGWQFLKARKKIKNGIAATPVVVVSAWTEQAPAGEEIAGYLKKPVDVDILLSLVHRFCNPWPNES